MFQAGDESACAKLLIAKACL
uniref:Uncharacterized protein n=1 Tax=Rhizophora mucronata TaxID=61149 RepID=A0A2P2PZB4_RHIMU